MSEDVSELRPGDTLEGPLRKVSVERLRIYGTSLASAVAGSPVDLPRNIHTDEDYARDQGWPGVIADGMITTNWISSLLLEKFGRHYLQNGDLRTKFIRPLLQDDVVQTRAVVKRVCRTADGTAISLGVTCSDGGERPFTVGSASVTYSELGSVDAEHGLEKV